MLISFMDFHLFVSYCSGKTREVTPSLRNGSSAVIAMGVISVA